MMHSRAVDSFVSAMPLLSFKEFRDGHAAAGVGPNDMAYYSQIQNWKFQTATPNNTTPYVNFYWNIADGPVVIEIAPSTDDVGIFGTIMDSWQRHRVLVNVSQISKRAFLRTISFYIFAQEADSLLQPEIMAV